MKIELDKKISREALETFQKWHKNGARTPREMGEALNHLLDEGCIDSDEYDAIVLSDWRKLDAADPNECMTREEIAAKWSLQEEVMCAVDEFVTGRGRIESVITKMVARLGGTFQVPTGKELWAHVFDCATCDEIAHGVWSLYLDGTSTLQADFIDGYEDMPFFGNCTEADLLTLADMLAKA